jgi:HlyD family secretion protein
MSYEFPNSVRSRKLRLAGAILLGSTALVHGCGGEEKEQEQVVAVQVTPAKRGPITLRVSAEAVVWPFEQAVITPKITSTISKFYVQRGSSVKQGQVLVRLENADLAGAAEQSKGEYEQAEAGYATTTGASLPQQIQKAELDATASKAAFDAQQKVFNARKELFDQGALPRRELDSAEVALVQARSQKDQAQKQLDDLQRLGKEQALKSAGGQLSAAKGKYLNAQAQLSYAEIRSPIDGVVTDRPLFPGELATANQPILMVMNTSKLIAKAHISQDEAALLKVGNPAELQLAGLEEPIKGRVMLVSPALDPASTTIEVWVEAIKPDAALKPGMNVVINATAKSLKEALVVPSSAIFKTPEGADYVLLAGRDGRAHLAKVKVGIRNKELAEIQSGLKENDSVITAGGYALPDNTKIKVEAAPLAEQEAEKDSSGKSEKPDRETSDKPGAASTPAKEKE